MTLFAPGKGVLIKVPNYKIISLPLCN